jgi:hypothetical protein
MSVDEIQTVLLEILREVQTLSGRPWSGLSPSAKPIGELDGFDSLSSVEATVMLEESLGWGDLEIESIFISEDGKRALTVDEIAQRLSEVAARRGKV